MLEHIFRNIDDIRIFDVMVDFVLDEDEEKVDINKVLDSVSMNIIDTDGIMDILDSLGHLVRQKILGIKKVKMEGTTGCKTCKATDEAGVPRTGEHKTHLAEEVSIGYIDNYYMKINEVTNGLRSAAFAHVFLTLENEIKEDKIKEDKIKEDKIKEDKIKEDKIKEDKIKEDKIEGGQNG
jgi:hypothetical protein